LGRHKPNHWTCDDIINQNLQLSDSAISSRFEKFEELDNPKCWVIEIDSKVIQKELSRENFAKACELECDEWFRSIELQLVGKEHSERL
jgi:hypothetical protein